MCSRCYISRKEEEYEMNTKYIKFLFCNMFILRSRHGRANIDSRVTRVCNHRLTCVFALSALFTYVTLGNGISDIQQLWKIVPFLHCQRKVRSTA